MKQNPRSPRMTRRSWIVTLNMLVFLGLFSAEVSAQNGPQLPPTDDANAAAADADITSDTELRLKAIEDALEKLKDRPLLDLNDLADEASVLFGLAGIGLVLVPMVLIAFGLYDLRGVHRSVEQEASKIRLDIDKVVREMRRNIEDQINKRIALLNEEITLQQNQLAEKLDSEVVDAVTHLGREVERQVADKLQRLIESSISGELSLIYGHLARDGERVKDKVLLTRATLLLKAALKHPGEMEWTYKNNLAYYYAIGEFRQNARVAIDLADQLEKHYENSTSEKKDSLLDTYVTVIVNYSKLGDMRARRRLPTARLITQALIERNITATAKRRLRRKLKEIDELSA